MVIFPFVDIECACHQTGNPFKFGITQFAVGAENVFQGQGADLVSLGIYRERWAFYQSDPRRIVIGQSKVFYTTGDIAAEK